MRGATIKLCALGLAIFDISGVTIFILTDILFMFSYGHRDMFITKAWVVAVRYSIHILGLIASSISYHGLKTKNKFLLIPLMVWKSLLVFLFVGGGIFLCRKMGTSNLDEMNLMKSYFTDLIASPFMVLFFVVTVIIYNLFFVFISVKIVRSNLMLEDFVEDLEK